MDVAPTRDLFDALTTGAAAVGAVLGVFNLWLYFDQRRVKLRVAPLAVLVKPASGDNLRFWHDKNDFPEEAGLGVEVVNLSAFPITITFAGFMDPKRKGARIMVNPPRGEEPWPRRLEPQESIHAYMNAQSPKDFANPERRQVGKAFAMTACGATVYGRNRALQNYQKLCDQQEGTIPS